MSSLKKRYSGSAFLDEELKAVAIEHKRREGWDEDFFNHVKRIAAKHSTQIRAISRTVHAEQMKKYQALSPEEQEKFFAPQRPDLVPLDAFTI